jgi:hypothetical protein
MMMMMMMEILKKKYRKAKLIRTNYIYIFNFYTYKKNLFIEENKQKGEIERRKHRTRQTNKKKTLLFLLQITAKNGSRIKT